MPKMTTFKYSGFYDVPRCISLQHCGVHFLLQSLFDEGLDEYPNVYSVSIVPSSADSLALWSSDFMSVPNTPLGQIPIEQVTFDASKRREVDATILDRFINQLKTI